MGTGSSAENSAFPRAPSYKWTLIPAFIPAFFCTLVPKHSILSIVQAICPPCLKQNKIF
jgi:hypothetical protein